jgi:hypothetical protein
VDFVDDGVVRSNKRKMPRHSIVFVSTVLGQKELGGFDFAPKKPENARFHSTITPPPRYQKFCFLATGKKISRKGPLSK